MAKKKNRNRSKKKTGGAPPSPAASTSTTKAPESAAVGITEPAPPAKVVKDDKTSSEINPSSGSKVEPAKKTVEATPPAKTKVADAKDTKPVVDVPTKKSADRSAPKEAPNTGAVSERGGAVASKNDQKAGEASTETKPSQTRESKTIKPAGFWQRIGGWFSPPSNPCLKAIGVGQPVDQSKPPSK